MNSVQIPSCLQPSQELHYSSTDIIYSVYTCTIKYVQHHVLATSPTSAFTLSWLWNLFAPTQTLLHTYNCHDHHHHHHHIIASSHHHITIIITLKFATPSEQYVDWGNNINYISMSDQHFPPLMSNMLIGVITSSLSS